MNLFYKDKQGIKGLLPLSPATPNPRRSSSASLRTISVDEAEHFRHNQNASVASLRLLFTFALERCSGSLRNRRSPSPEYPSTDAGFAPTRALPQTVREYWGIRQGAPGQRHFPFRGAWRISGSRPAASPHLQFFHLHSASRRCDRVGLYLSPIARWCLGSMPRTRFRPRDAPRPSRP